MSRPAVVVIAGARGVSESGAAALGRVFAQLPAGSLLVDRGRPGFERSAVCAARDIGLHVASVRCRRAAGASVREAVGLARLRPSLVLAAPEPDEDGAVVVRLGHACGAEVWSTDGGRSAVRGLLRQTDARAAGAVESACHRRLVGFAGASDWRDLALLDEGFRGVAQDDVVVAGADGGLDRLAETVAWLRGNVVVGVAAYRDRSGREVGVSRFDAIVSRGLDEARVFSRGGRGGEALRGSAEEADIPVVEPARPHRLVAEGVVVDCRGGSYDCYIGSQKDPESDGFSEWANRYGLRRYGRPGEVVVSSAEAALVCFRVHLIRLVRSGRLSPQKLIALHGRVFGCSCSLQWCHGEVLEQAAMWAMSEQARVLERRVAEMLGRR